MKDATKNAMMMVSWFSGTSGTLFIGKSFPYISSLLLNVYMKNQPNKDKEKKPMQSSNSFMSMTSPPPRINNVRSLIIPSASLFGGFHSECVSIDSLNFFSDRYRITD